MKKNISDLAIFGGTPLFNSPLFVGRPNVMQKEAILVRIENILDSKWFTNDGPYVREFEEKLKDYLGVKHVIATCNGTVALELATRALGFSGEVIVPSFTFIATAHSLMWQNIKPVFCDINSTDFTIDVNEIEKHINENTTGIIGVHLWGRPCNIEKIEEIAQRKNLSVIYDAAHALGCDHNGKKIGTFGDAEIFSFHATKFINSFEGGAITTNNDELAQKLKLMRNFGFNGFDNVEYIGTNGKMSEVCAAMGITSFDSIKDIIGINELNYSLYVECCKNLESIEVLEYENKKNNFQYIVLRVNEDKIGISRDRIIDILFKENIVARRYFYPGCHKQMPYVEDEFYNEVDLPQTDKLSAEVICMPTGTSVGAEEIKKICSLLSFIEENNTLISKRE